jgi:hypothetical protein
MTSKEWGVAVWAMFHSQPQIVPVATIEAIIAALARSEEREVALVEALRFYATDGHDGLVARNALADVVNGGKT